jgi:N-methylhydantoinase A
VAAAAPTGTRRILLEEGPAEVPVLPFARLAPDQVVAGPAIVESDTTTVLLRPGDSARMDGRGWLEVAVPAA